LLSLEQLLLNENKILQIEGVMSLKKLNTFDLSDNLIIQIRGLENLTELWLTNNKVELFSELENLRILRNLKTIYLERCPVYSYPDYKVQILAVCPWIRQIDALMVNG
jgi:Leucine-rich repeat (LRR) protein